VQLLLLRRRVDDLTTWTLPGLEFLHYCPCLRRCKFLPPCLPAKPPGAAAPAGRCCCSRC
jgi:hypothetical protein